MRAEERHRRRRRRRRRTRPRYTASVQRRDRGDRRAVTTRGRHGVDRFVVQHDLASHRLGVDDGRFSSHGDRFLQRADAQLDVHRDHAGARHDQAFAFHAREARKREGQVIRARRHIRKAVLTGAVADDRPALFDQRRAARLDRDTGSTAADGSRTTPAIVDWANSTAGSDKDPRERNDDGQNSTHHQPPQPASNVQFAARLPQGGVACEVQQMTGDYLDRSIVMKNKDKIAP